MRPDLLVTGPPRSGKTTVIQRASERLDARDYRAGGVYCPEIRSEGDRVGFEIAPMGFIGDVEDRDDTETFEVTEDTRDEFPATLTERLLAVL